MNIENVNLLAKSHEASAKRSEGSNQEPFSDTLKNQLDYAKNAKFSKNDIKTTSEMDDTEASAKSTEADDENVTTDETLLEMLPLSVHLCDNTGKLGPLPGGGQKASAGGDKLALGLLSQRSGTASKQVGEGDDQALSSFMSDFAKNLTLDEFKPIQELSSMNSGTALSDGFDMTSVKGLVEDISTPLLSNAASSLSQAPETLAVTKPLTHPDWDKQLAEQIVWLTHKGIDSAEITLNPEHLGPVSIRIDVEHDQTSIQFTTPHAAVKEALEASMPKLKEIFAGQQLNLVDVNILSDTGSQQAGTGARQQEHFVQTLSVVDTEQKEENEVVKRLTDVRLLNTYA